MSVNYELPVTMTTSQEKPTTTIPEIVKKSNPDSNIIPGLDNYWAVIVCASAATLLLLAITLCFAFNANR